MSRRSSIGIKLTALLLVFSLVPLIAVSLIAYKTTQEALRSAFGSALEESAFQVIDKIDRLLFFAQENVKSWAGKRTLQNIAGGDASGDIRAFLNRREERYGVYSALYCINPLGEIISATNADAIGQNVSDRVWFQDVLKSNQVVIHDLAYDPLDQGFSIKLSAPIFDKSTVDTSLIGVLSTRFRWSELNDLTNAVTVGGREQTEWGYVVLLNKEGYVLTGPGFILANQRNRTRDARYITSKNFLKDGMQAPRLAQSEPKGSLVETTPEGRNVLVGYASSRGHRHFEGLHWSALVIQDEQRAFAPARKLITQSIMIIALVALLSALTALIVSQRITIPIGRLTVAAGALAKGEFDHQITVTSRDEIGRLAAAFRKMAADLARNMSLRKEAEEKLVSSERLAALGQLAGTVSHELRNPLGTIRTSLFTIKNKVSGKGLGVERALDRAERNIIRCDNIISDMLNYVRKPKLRFETTSIDQWLDATLDEHGVPTNVTLRRELNSGAELAFDHDRFRRAVINTVDNACQAMEQEREAGVDNKEHVLTVNTRVADGRLEVSVSDTGPGISAEHLAQIFEPLFSTKSFGVGLGLPTVKLIMEEHGGDIELSSEENQGTRAVLWLPITASAEIVS